jgi:aminoglycoside phosphotransferase (APT) family kinase protein
VCEQRDFSPWNVLVSPSGDLAVVDWESAEPRGLPGLDLVYFLAHASFFVEGTMGSGREPATYAAMLEPSSVTGEVFLECASRYADRTGIDEAALVPLRLLAWMIHAPSDHAHLALGADGAPDRRDLAASLFLKLWREDLGRIGAAASRTSGAEIGPAIQT